MTTTTLAVIKARMVSDIKAITPGYLSDTKLDRSPKHVRIRDWAPEAGSAALRRFEIARTGGTDDGEIWTVGINERREQVEITVAYPLLPAMYRIGSTPDEMLDMDEIIRSDARQIADAVRKNENRASIAHLASFPRIEPPETDNESVWFQTITVEVLYYEASEI